MSDESKTKYTNLDPHENREFERKKLSGTHPVHRLRNWDPGDIVWGWDVISDDVRSGKTYRRTSLEEDTSPDPTASNRSHWAAHRAFQSEVERRSNGRAFLWVGRIHTIHQESVDPYDPGEPPLKTASFQNVHVVESYELSPTFTCEVVDDE